MPSQIFDDFCAAVMGQIRNPYVRASITAELAAHLEDRTQALGASGLTSSQAEAAAIAAMGDPAEVGRAFNRVYRPVWYYIYRCLKPFAVLGAVFLLGVAVLNSLSNNNIFGIPRLFPPRSAYESLREEFSSYKYVRPVTVTGGGTLGEYRVEPVGDAHFLIDPNAPAGSGIGWLSFTIQTAHWQPWLSDLSADNLTLSSSDGSSRSAAHFVSAHPDTGRLVALSGVDFPDLHLDSFPCTVTLSSSDQRVQFQVDLIPLGGDAP